MILQGSKFVRRDAGLLHTLTREDIDCLRFIAAARANRTVGYGAGLGNKRSAVITQVCSEQRAMAVEDHTVQKAAEKLVLVQHGDFWS